MIDTDKIEVQVRIVHPNHVRELKRSFDISELTSQSSAIISTWLDSVEKAIIQVGACVTDIPK